MFGILQLQDLFFFFYLEKLLELKLQVHQNWNFANQST
jgi:hypothetical protein